MLVATNSVFFDCTTVDFSDGGAANGGGANGGQPNVGTGRGSIKRYNVGMANSRITVEMLSELLGMPAQCFRDTAEAQAFARNIVRVLQAAVDLGNDPKTALYHVKNSPIRSVEYKTALEMIEGGRTNDVVAYLQSLSAGYVG